MENVKFVELDWNPTCLYNMRVWIDGVPRTCENCLVQEDCKQYEQEKIAKESMELLLDNAAKNKVMISILQSMSKIADVRTMPSCLVEPESDVVKVALWVPRSIYEFLSKPGLNYDLQAQFLDGLKSDLDTVFTDFEGEVSEKAAELEDNIIQLLGDYNSPYRIGTERDDFHVRKLH